MFMHSTNNWFSIHPRYLLQAVFTKQAVFFCNCIVLEVVDEGSYQNESLRKKVPTPIFGLGRFLGNGGYPK